MRSDRKTIDDLRAAIDVIDQELLSLLNRRAQLAVEAGRAKIGAGMPIRDGARERDVLARTRDANAGPLDEHAIGKIFRRIVRETRGVEMRKIEKFEADGKVAQ